ncbi:MAG: ribulose-phosphate 3-epimerase [Calditrichia bacterium]
MANFKLLPSILAADHGRFLEEVASTGDQIDSLHIDVMDGHFVPNITFGPKVVASLKANTSYMLDVHLMIDQVDLYTPLFAEAGADIITIHQEATRHLHRSLDLIRSHNVKVGVAVNPATSLDTLKWILDDVDLVLIMSVNPGFGGQSFIEASLEKIRALDEMRRNRRLSFVIEVDGGVDMRTAPLVYEAGADYLVAGSAIFGKKDRRAAVKGLHEVVASATGRTGTLYT